VKILVIGGTSFFGKDIVDLALDAGHQVTIFSRGSQRPDFWDQVDHIFGDRTDKIDFAKTLANKQFDAVIDNIAYTREDVVNALNVFQGNIGRYILTSTVAIYIGRGAFDQPVREDDANFKLPEKPQFVSAVKPTPLEMIDYATGKIEAEQAVLEQEKVPYTIIRPPNILGPEDNTGRLQFYFQRLLDGKPLILTNGGVHSFQPVFSRDLASGYLLALDSSKAVNQVYIIAQDKTYRLVEWVEFVAKCLGVQPNLINIPEDVIQKANFEYAEHWTYTSTHTFDISKTINDLGFQPTPIETWTARTAQWYRETTHENDSPGYTDREKEIEFAEQYLEKIASLNS
jgi:nucleoside-diphosphate-sugar epimerase